MQREWNMLIRVSALCGVLGSTAVLSSCTSVNTTTEAYGIETLTLSLNKVPAPASIVESLTTREGKALDFDRSEGIWTNANELFAVQPIDLTGTGKNDLLVYRTHFDAINQLLFFLRGKTHDFFHDPSIK